MRLRELLVGALILSGCGGDCDRPEVKGFDDTEILQRAQQAVDAFFDRLPDDARVCVSKVKLGETLGPNGGWYRRLDRRVKIDAVANGPYVDWAVTHELCHAADLQLGIDPHQDPDLWTFDDAPRSYSKRRSPRESFASTCQVGPYGYDLMARSCPDDSDRLRQVVSALAQVYGPGRATPLDLVPLAAIDVGDALVDDIVVHSDQVVSMLVDDAELYVDLATGRPVPPTDAPSIPFDGGSTRPMSHRQTLFVGPYSQVAIQWPTPNGEVVDRVVTEEGVGCPALPFQEVQLDVDERVVLFHRDGPILSWSRYEPAY